MSVPRRSSRWPIRLAVAVLASLVIMMAAGFLLAHAVSNTPLPSVLPIDRVNGTPTVAFSEQPSSATPAPTALALTPTSSGSLAAPVAPAPVGFALNIQQVEPPQPSVFLSVTVRVHLKATLTNLGDLPAHRVAVSVRARVDDSYVTVNGSDPYIVSIGDMQLHQAITQDLVLELHMGLADGKRAQQDGIILETLITSDERTQALPPLHCTEGGCIE